MPSDFDVLVIGGGLVGTAAACALRTSGLRIGVIEAQPRTAGQPRLGERTVALSFGSRRIFEGMGVWPTLAPATVPIQRIHISDRGRFGVTRLAARDVGIDALGYVVPNRVLGEVLNNALDGQERLSIFCPATLEGVTIAADAAVVDIQHQDTRRTLRARLLIAADGAESAVREHLGIVTRRVDYGQVAIVTSVKVERAHNNTAFERFTDQGPLALLPAPDGRCVVVLSVASARARALMACPEPEFLAHLEEYFGERLGRFTDLAPRQAHPLILTRVDEHTRPRVALIGNAAHTVHPVAGQGFNLGLRDVAVLAEIVMNAQVAGGDFGHVDALREYADWRARDNRAVTALTHSLVRIFSNEYFPLTFVRNAALIAVDLFPPVKRHLIRVTSGLAFRQPRLARGLPL